MTARRRNDEEKEQEGREKEILFEKRSRVKIVRQKKKIDCKRNQKIMQASEKQTWEKKGKRQKENRKEEIQQTKQRTSNLTRLIAILREKEKSSQKSRLGILVENCSVYLQIVHSTLNCALWSKIEKNCGLDSFLFSFCYFCRFFSDTSPSRHFLISK